MKHLVLLFIVLCIPYEFIAQGFCIDSIGDESILSLAEDETHLWMGTENSGLIKMDKSDNSFTYIDSSNSDIVSNRIRNLLINNDVLYFSTDSNIFSIQNNEMVVAFEGLSGDMVAIPPNIGINPYFMGIATDSDFYLWNGIDLYHQINFFEIEGVQYTCGICDNTTDVVVAENGDIWISHFGFYVYNVIRFDGESWSTYTSQTDPGILPIESAHFFNKMAIKDNVLLNTSWSGLTKFDEETWTTEHNSYQNPTIIQNNDTLQDAPTALAYDQTQGYWVGTQVYQFMESSYNLAYYDETNWHLYQLASTDLICQDILPSLYDNNLVYIATNSGLIIIDKTCLGVGIFDQLPINLPTVIYPNPSNGKFLLQLNNPINSDASILFFDTQGRIAFTHQITKGEQFIDFGEGDLSPGTYTFFLNGHQSRTIVIN